MTAEREIVLEERPCPTLRPDQVIVEVELCGICGSDLHAALMPQVYHGDCILGHESTGHIVAVGAEIAEWVVGQRVAINPNGNIVTPLSDALSAFDLLRSGRIMKALIAPSQQ
ncbi:alcohol dehydrogenase catalytic domain-containing protein [Mycobacterium sp. JS623]|uniref:alcohol dehydrogenase catalytic domain-containing protein n=1 Tax=Mycobacterium sp. JS623 TaxID=212767 RepID=UPI0012FC3F67|nr:alcohol dehydrogenase catalytic domain-containing protein [Mycobacterium sp. JS623]